MNKNIIKQTLGKTALNTHFFDGKLREMIKYIQNDIIRVSNIQKRVPFNNLAKIIYSNSNKPTVLKCLAVIISSYNSSGRNKRSSNYDSINDLYACDLLYLIYEKICIEKNEEYTKLLIQQLDEMATGLCSQGRTTRLFQVLVMLKDKLE